MRYEGIVYRPPSEAESLLIQATIGCPHNRCTFCGMYRTKKFKIRPVADIKEDLKRAQELYGNDVESIFFPDFTRLRTYNPAEGTPLGEEYQQGEFRLLSPHAAIRETRLLVENLRGPGQLMSDHVSNFAWINGELPADKPTMIAELDRLLNVSEDSFTRADPRYL